MNHEGIIITQTPFRLSFFGGGTDFPAYFNEHEGSVIATAIDKYLYVTINSLKRFYEKRIRLSYSNLEIVNSLNELQHGIVRTILEHHPFFDDESFIDMHTFADLPASCGMGSSSAFTVGFLNALYSLNGTYRTPKEIALEAIDIEREKLKDAGGWQDQIMSAYGGLNLIHFKHNQFTVEPIALPLEKKRALENACLLFFTGGTRSSAEIQKNTFTEKNDDKTQRLKTIQQAVSTCLEILRANISSQALIQEFGRLLDQSWQAKRSLSSHISNDLIDSMYEKAVKAGAIGGKLCGAGGHGFLLVIASPEKKDAIIQALSEYKMINVNFNDFGSRVIHSKIIS